MDQKKAMAAPKAGKGAKWTVSQGASMCGVEIKDNTLKVSGDTLKVDALNSFLRTLAAYVEYLDDTGKPMGGRSYNRIIGPVDTIMGIPIPAGGTTIETALPKDASGLAASWSRNCLRKSWYGSSDRLRFRRLLPAFRLRDGS